MSKWYTRLQALYNGYSKTPKIPQFVVENLQKLTKLYKKLPRLRHNVQSTPEIVIIGLDANTLSLVFDDSWLEFEPVSRDMVTYHMFYRYILGIQPSTAAVAKIVNVN